MAALAFDFDTPGWPEHRVVLILLFEIQCCTYIA
jgi:hypothetical protein